MRIIHNSLLKDAIVWEVKLTGGMNSVNISRKLSSKCCNIEDQLTYVSTKEVDILSLSLSKMKYTGILPSLKGRIKFTVIH